MNRGNRKEPIFEDTQDRLRFLRILVEEKETHGVELLAGCQMWNHFHLLLLTHRANLSDFMEQLEGRFARYSNWRHNHVGHLFQGRFRDVFIEHDIHLLTALCYIFFNPVSAGLVTRLEDYKWSTYAATVGSAPLPGYLSVEWLQALFPCETVKESQRCFRELMTAANPVLSYCRETEADVDPDSIRRTLRSFVGEQLQMGALPHIYRSALRATLAELFPVGMPTPARAQAIYDARVVHGYRPAEIARELGLHPATVSKVFSALRKSRIA